MNQQQRVRDMYSRTAPRYVARIDPAFEPLAEGLVVFAALHPEERVLDLGTGSGLAAIAAAPHVRHVVGLDYSRPLLEQAHAKLVRLERENVTLVHGDMHALGFADNTFDVALAAFSFNSTEPARAFSETVRVLVPGGRLVMQEWGARDDLSEIIYDVMDEYRVEDPPPALAALRTAMATPDAWDELESVEDLTKALAGADFREVSTHTQTYSIAFESADTYLNYKLAWASRHEELEAMSQEWRGLLFSELHDRLEPHLTDDGGLIWQPEVIRVRAEKAAR
jgi:ubiquinone/menaquinone biosynthesis C-methylase UbiE